MVPTTLTPRGKIFNESRQHKKLTLLNLSDISYYSTAYTSDAVYIIGGRVTRETVAEFMENQWRKLDNLNQGRGGHGSITINGQTMIVGGTYITG